MEALSTAPALLPPRLLLFDGVCGLCDRFVQWAIARDPNSNLVFAPLQGETAAALRLVHPEIPEHLDTLVFIEDGKVFMYSAAVLNACRHLRGPWPYAAVFLWVPRPLRDLVYKLVARNRYSIWGKSESCRVPSDAELAKFLP